MENGEQNHRNWLQRVQEQSWEPEILISGIVLFALFQIPQLIRQGADFLDVYSIMIFSNGTFDETMSVVLLTANYWLIIGFTAHLISRSIWAAFVGLSYIYKDGIKLDRLNYGERYKRIIAKNRDYKAMIMPIERFCSGVFAISFLLFMCVIGTSFFFLVVGGLIALSLELFPDSIKYLDNIDPILIPIALIYLIDFVSLGLFKRIPIVNKIYYPFYRVMSVLTLSPLYRGIYYGIISNHKKWKVALGMLLFVASSLLIAESIQSESGLMNSFDLTADSDSSKDYLFPGNYLNLAGSKPSKKLILESDIIDKNVAKVLLVSSGELEKESIIEGCNYNELAESGEHNLDSLTMECLKNFYRLELDGEEIYPDYLYYKDERINREGLMAYVDLSSLPRGIHEFKLYLKFIEDGEISERITADAEFFKEAPIISQEPKSSAESQTLE